jgi:hypothetical protein
VLFDPQLTILRSSREGRKVYAGSMRRIASRDQRPPAPLLHCAGTRGEDFLAFTAFSSREEMMAMYTSYTAPESVNEIVDSGVSIDISRDENELAAMHISDLLPQAEFGAKSPGSIAVVYCELVVATFEDYLKVTEKTGILEGEPHGVLAHLAFNTPEGIRILDAWESRALGERWYDGSVPEKPVDGDWLELDSFVVCTPPGPSRRFVRGRTGSPAD